jgi:predicted nucleic acid-binding protein
MYVLDTNIVVAALNGDERAVRRLRNLLYGAAKSLRRDANVARVKRLSASFRVAPVDEELIERYSVVRAEVENTGRTKSDFDLLIACSALRLGATLVTHDAALKAGDIAGLVVEDWLDQ